jgi:hypothetical protein
MDNNIYKVSFGSFLWKKDSRNDIGIVIFIGYLRIFFLSMTIPPIETPVRVFLSGQLVVLITS